MNERTKDRKHGWALTGPSEYRPQTRSERWSIPMPWMYCLRDRPGVIYKGYVTRVSEKQAPATTIHIVLQIRFRIQFKSCTMLPSVHKSAEVSARWDGFGVRLEFFVELKAWVKKNRGLALAFGDDYGGFIELTVQGKHFASCFILMEEEP